MLLKDKVCIVTGAGRGIGRCVAELFAAEGAKVYALDIIGLEWIDNASNIVPMTIDLCDFVTVKASVMAAYKESGRIDVLANIAGLISYEFMPMIDYDKFRKMMEVNVISLVHMTDLISRLMKRTGGGSIINMASMVGVNGAKGQLSYSATKGAVIALTKSAAKELAEYHIRVNAIAPAMVETERFKDVLENQIKESAPQTPFGRLAQPMEIAQACLFMASDQSSYVTGQILGVDGGIVLGGGNCLKISYLQNKRVCVVTGGAKGIGKQIALQLASEGATVYVCDLQECQVNHNNIHSVVLDVTDIEAIKSTLMYIYIKEGHIDCLINNAGVIINKNMGMTTPSDTDLMYKVNVQAVFEMIKYVGRFMARNGGGSIVNIASITAVIGSPGQVAYSATKGAIISMTKSAAKELAPMGIRVNAVAPGIVKTERFAELYETTNAQKIEDRISKIALGRLGTPEDIAYACSFLASDRSSYITGQILGVDGCASI